jgi:hypothetical protein
MVRVGEMLAFDAAVPKVSIAISNAEGATLTNLIFVCLCIIINVVKKNAN